MRVSTRSKFRFGISTTAIVIALAAGGQALAQDVGGPVPDGSEEAASTVDEIIVTATRRGTRIQDTPIAISALAEESLTNAGATSMQDVTRLVPSLTVGGGSDGGGRLTLRGIQAAGEATVGLYYDEVPMTGPSDTTQNPGGASQDANLFDVERIEVLRGPQGTLFGSGSMGGTVRVIFNKADTHDYSGVADAQYSDTSEGDPNYFARLAVNAPLIEGVLGARIALWQQERGGYIDDIRYGQENINRRTMQGGRLQLTYTPTEDITWHGMVMIQQTDSPGGGSAWYPLLGEDEFKTDRYVIPIVRDDLYLYSSDLEWDLGFASLNMSNSFYRWERLTASDYTNTMIANRRSVANCTNWFNMSLMTPTVRCDAAQLDQFTAFANSLMPTTLYKPSVVDTWDHEIRITSQGEGPLQWTAGVFYETRDDFVDSTLGVVNPNNGRIPEPLDIFFHRDINTKVEQLAYFGDASYEVLDGLTLSVGARKYDYKKTTQGQTDMPNWVSGSLVEPFTSYNADASGWLMKYNVSYEFDGPYMIYANAAQGFRPGGANNTPNLEAALVAYGPDQVWNYELGVKTAWFDNRLIFNAAVYQIDWEDIQTSARTLSGCCSFIVNAGEAEIRGLELEVTARPIDGLTVNAGVVFSDPVLKKDQINADIQDTTSLGDAGDQIPDVADFQASAGAEYFWPITSGLSGMARFDYNYVGKSYSVFRPTNTYFEEQGSFGIVNLRTGVESDTGWGAYVFANNVFNVIGAYTRTSGSGSEQLVNSSLPRTIGVNVRRSF